MNYINQICNELESIFSKDRFVTKRNVVELTIRDDTLNLGKSKSNMSLDVEKHKSLFENFFLNGMNFADLFASLSKVYADCNKDQMYEAVLLIKTICAIGYFNTGYGSFIIKDAHKVVTGIQYDKDYKWLTILVDGVMAGELVAKPADKEINVSEISFSNVSEYDSNDIYIMRYMLACLNSILSKDRRIDNGDRITYDISSLFESPSDYRIVVNDYEAIMTKFNRDGDIKALHEAICNMSKSCNKIKVYPLSVIICLIYSVAGSKLPEVSPYSKILIPNAVDGPYKYIDVSKDGTMISVNNLDGTIFYVATSSKHTKMVETSETKSNDSEELNLPLMEFLSEKFLSCIPSNYIVNTGIFKGVKSYRFSISDDMTSGIKWHKINALIKDMLAKEVMSYSMVEEIYNAIGYYYQQNLRSELRGNQIKYLAALTLLTYHIESYVGKNETESRLIAIKDSVEFNMTKKISYIDINFADNLVTIQQENGNVLLKEKPPVKFFGDVNSEFSRPEELTDAQVTALEKLRNKNQKSKDVINKVNEIDSSGNTAKVLNAAKRTGDFVGNVASGIQDRVGGPAKATNSGFNPLFIVAIILLLFVIIRFLI